MRSYDPETGSYLTQDPVGAEITGPNRYAYAAADPLTLTDPTGELYIVATFLEEVASELGEVASCAILRRGVSDPCLLEEIEDFCNTPVSERLLGIGIGTIAPHVKWAERLDFLQKLLRKAGPKLKRKIQPIIDKINRHLWDERGSIGLPRGKVPRSTLRNPHDIRFSQDSIRREFREKSKGTFEDLAKGLADGSVDPRSVPPIRLVERDGHLITLDNRRLQAYRMAGVDIPTVMASPKDVAEAIERGKFSAGPLGSPNIRVRED